MNLTTEQQALLKDIPDAMFRQTVRDFMVNQQFRKDYWVKGARKLNPLEQAEALRAQKVILVQPRADVSLKITGSIGEATLQEAVYGPILDALADHKPRTLGQIEQAVKDKGVAAHGSPRCARDDEDSPVIATIRTRHCERSAAIQSIIARRLLYLCII